MRSDLYTVQLTLFLVYSAVSFEKWIWCVSVKEPVDPQTPSVGVKRSLCMASQPEPAVRTTGPIVRGSNSLWNSPGPATFQQEPVEGREPPYTWQQYSDQGPLLPPRWKDLVSPHIYCLLGCSWRRGRGDIELWESVRVLQRGPLKPAILSSQILIDKYLNWRIV